MWLVVLACLGGLWLWCAAAAYRRYRREIDRMVSARATFPASFSSPLVGLSATAMAGAIRRGETTSVECCLAAIERIRACNPSMNALVADRFEEALEEAREADRKTDKSAPFHGVPMTVKESFAVTGMPNSGGLLSRRHVRADRDAPTVKRLREAGFIILGVSNVSELCMWCESSNPIYGRSASSKNVRVTSGGSSGGEGALVGSHCVPVGLGSDIGGSIRMPAFFNGAFGLKPTAGLVPNEGQFPVAISKEANLFQCTGPIANYAIDLHPLLCILSAKSNLPNPNSISVKSIRVFSMLNIGIWGLFPPKELIDAQRLAMHFMPGRCEIVEPFPEFKNAIEIWTTLLQAAETESFSEKLYGKTGNIGILRSMKELFLWSIGNSNHTLPAIGLALIENLTGFLMSEKRIANLKSQAEILRNRIESLIGDDGVLFFPSFASLPPFHSAALALPVMWIYTAIFNTLHLPVVQMPFRRMSCDNRPLGIQIVAKRNCDHVAIAAAIYLQEKMKDM